MRKPIPLRISLVLGFCLMLLVITPSMVGHMKAKKAAASKEAAPAPPVKAAVKLQGAQQLGSNIEGGWSTLVPLDTVPVHISLLPDGRLLYWGRDKDDSPSKWDRAGSCQTYTWNPVTGAKKTITNTTTNLFCSGHSFLPDGRLFVAGGHNREESAPDIEGIGETDINMFDYRSNSWERLAQSMEEGRWYPSTVTMANGETAIFSGKYWDGVKTTSNNGRIVPAPELNTHPEIFTRQETLREFANDSSVATYPYLHLTPSGKVFIPSTVDAGGNNGSASRLFDPDANGGQGAFTLTGSTNNVHNHGSSTLYDSVNGKIILTGNSSPQISGVSIIDLTNNPQWRYPTPTMTYGRNFSTATLLPNGKVLVTGGTRCAGINTIKCAPDFPNGEGAATRPELWNPDPLNESWTLMAPNPSGIARVYHSVAILLPDARVLYGGGGLPTTGGESVGNEQCRADIDSYLNSVACRTSGHRDAEIFSPPYLFDASGNPAPRPFINTAPPDISYGQSFSVTMGDSAHVKDLVLVRLGSVTHGLNTDQRRVVLSFTQSGQTLSVTAPADGKLAPPGPYMLFALNDDGTPSVAKMVNVLLRTNAEDYIARRSLRSNGKVHVFYSHLGDRRLRYMSTPANVALGKSATQSSTAYGGVASRAVDGNTSGDYGQNSVTHTNNHWQPWWQVDLGAVGQLDSVRVWNRTDGGADRVSNFYVLVSDAPFAYTTLNETITQPGVSSYYIAGTAGKPTNVTVGRTGRYVRVQLAGTNWLNLAEVEVLGSLNIALGKSATQISTAYGGVASRAVDGNTSGDYGQNSVTHTNNHWQPWWQVDLGAVGQLDSVRVWNRTDGGADRVSNFYVLVSDAPFSSDDLETARMQQGVSSYYTAGIAGRPTNIPVGRTGRYVRVQLTGTNWLNLAEVEVLGVLPDVSEQFSAPVDLGRVVNSDPIAVENADGRLQVFVTGTDDAIYTRWESVPGSGNWQGWIKIGPPVSNLTGLAAARNLDGRIQVFYRGTNNALWYISQTAANSATWTAESSLGGGITSDPAVGMNRDGRLEVFARGNAYGLHHKWQDSPGGSWSDWQALGGYITSGPFVTHSSDGRLHVFARGAGNGVHYNAQTVPNTTSGWTNWQPLGGSMRGDHPSNNPVAALTANGRLQVFVRWDDNTLRTLIQNADGSFPYNAWSNLSGSVNATIPPPVRGNNGLFLQFARGTGDNGTNLMVNRQLNANFLNWSGFTLLGDSAQSF